MVCSNICSIFGSYFFVSSYSFSWHSNEIYSPSSKFGFVILSYSAHSPYLVLGDSCFFTLSFLSKGGEPLSRRGEPLSRRGEPLSKVGLSRGRSCPFDLYSFMLGYGFILLSFYLDLLSGCSLLFFSFLYEPLLLVSWFSLIADL